MCVILYKPKNILLPKREILENCFRCNSDGSGYTFTSGKNVIVKKGYKDFNTFYKELLKDYKKYHLTDHNLILHFRIGTSGGLTKEKTQPFKITNNVKELNKLYIRNKKSSIVHNGILNNFTYDNTLSDTQNYIKDFLQPLLHSKIKNKSDLIKDTIQTSKLAILNKNDKVSLYGEYIRYKGIYYSNNSFNCYVTPTGSVVYNFTNHNRKEVRRYNKENCNNLNSSSSKFKYYNYNFNIGESFYEW